MSTVIITKNISKVRFNKRKMSDKYRWFNEPKGLFFKQPSGIYLTKYNYPATLIGVLATNYQDAIDTFDNSKYEIVQNEDGTIDIFNSANVEIWYIGHSEPDVYSFKNDDLAKKFYTNILDKLENKIDVCVLTYEN